MRAESVPLTGPLTPVRNRAFEVKNEVSKGNFRQQVGQRCLLEHDGVFSPSEVPSGNHQTRLSPSD